jgi:hypothetical protein
MKAALGIDRPGRGSIYRTDRFGTLKIGGLLSRANHSAPQLLICIIVAIMYLYNLFFVQN